jgi:hypothetical protein
MQQRSGHSNSGIINQTGQRYPPQFLGDNCGGVSHRWLIGHIH